MPRSRKISFYRTEPGGCRYLCPNLHQMPNFDAQIMQSAILSDHINDLFKLCLQLENKFINLKPHMKKHIKVLRLRIRALHLVFLMKATNKSALNSTELLLKELDGLQKEEDIIQDFAF